MESYDQRTSEQSPSITIRNVVVVSLIVPYLKP
jgi:hypothetical protein